MQMYNLARRGLALGLVLSFTTAFSLAQRDVRSRAGRTSGSAVKAVKTADDPSIPSPSELGPDTDSRLFVESFMRALFVEDPGAVYDTYVHHHLQDALGRADFATQVTGMRQALGRLDRMAVRYLRDDNARYDGADGGWGNYVLVTERDPNVGVRVDFRRAGDGLWRVFSYSVQSAQMERLTRVREAAKEAERKADGVAAGEEPPPAPSP